MTNQPNNQPINKTYQQSNKQTTKHSNLNSDFLQELWEPYSFLHQYRLSIMQTYWSCLCPLINSMAINQRPIAHISIQHLVFDKSLSLRHAGLMNHMATVGPIHTCADKHKLGHKKIIFVSCLLTKTFQCMFYPATVGPLYTCANKHKLGHNKIIFCFLFTDQNISMFFFQTSTVGTINT